MSALFREEVSQNSPLPLLDGLALQSGPLSTVALFIAMLTAAALIWLLSVASVARKEHVPGYLVPSAGVTRVTSPRSGIVTNINVVEGQLVKAMDPLISISAPRDTAAGVNVDAIQVSHLRAELASIKQQMLSETKLATQEQTIAKRQAKDLRLQAELVASQISSAKEKTELMHREVERMIKLRARGHIASDIVDTKSVTLIDAEQAVQSLEREQVDLNARIEDLVTKVEQSRLRAELRKEELKARALGIQRSIAEAEAQWVSVINTPVSGRATSVSAYVGMAVSASQTLLAVVPSNSRLQAELLIPTRAAGFVRAGQQVRFRYDAFPYQKFGLFEGTIKSVSHAVLTPDDQNGPMHLSVPAYKAIAILNSQMIEIDGSGFGLQPGLLLQADIIGERRTLMEWFFEPVMAVVKGI